MARPSAWDRLQGRKSPPLSQGEEKRVVGRRENNKTGVRKGGGSGEQRKGKVDEGRGNSYPTLKHLVSKKLSRAFTFTFFTEEIKEVTNKGILQARILGRGTKVMGNINIYILKRH